MGLDASKMGSGRSAIDRLIRRSIDSAARFRLVRSIPEALTRIKEAPETLGMALDGSRCLKDGLKRSIDPEIGRFGSSYGSGSSPAPIPALRRLNKASGYPYKGSRCL